ncbi:hypothetical protein D6T64_12015 [Cryobacterium melibiosiphilum]|uniref:Uncharacterized protein n=1 Tax=Cryobacterium melibiosiphilum TaxID=995039 RepID=A0A3A5MLW7_9MICO|nr:hypothetical protein [Cryobacterium melibiosiphilum]RJT88108.1 hypothetical protein D6T64_12015 [Cryobacterium melibiosiphilum]
MSAESQEAKVAAYIKRVVDAAPPLSASQKDLIRGIFADTESRMPVQESESDANMSDLSEVISDGEGK